MSALMARQCMCFGSAECMTYMVLLYNNDKGSRRGREDGTDKQRRAVVSYLYLNYLFSSTLSFSMLSG